ncbi:hypothetical protein [Spirosoma spitsbergense]|uniref:hypothetical protein n=1 Tax=Spirosoma spitsbergense TaxID=431554 RepID=UPI0003820F01|nr:hypothetical protein [Spirosoma spitsbergense]
MMNLQTFQARLGQLDILSVAEANAAIGGGGCNPKSNKQKSNKQKSNKQKSNKSNKGGYCPPPPCW